ncbi:MAG: hypothetical protein IPL21_02110 [Saprospirales bacterium]|nr:hypothetical protein [Saprospirales bacterium]
MVVVAQLKLEKYDKDLNLIWSKNYLSDTAFLHGLYYTGNAYSDILVKLFNKYD